MVVVVDEGGGCLHLVASSSSSYWLEKMTAHGGGRMMMTPWTPAGDGGWKLEGTKSKWDFFFFFLSDKSRSFNILVLYPMVEIQYALGEIPHLRTQTPKSKNYEWS